jgi:hypothetical protein
MRRSRIELLFRGAPLLDSKTASSHPEFSLANSPLMPLTRGRENSQERAPRREHLTLCEIPRFRDSPSPSDLSIGALQRTVKLSWLRSWQFCEREGLAVANTPVFYMAATSSSLIING